MASRRLAKVALSVTTLDPKLARVMEPRAATPARRLDALRQLTEAGIPTSVMVAPVIPALNDSEIERILDAAAAVGVKEAGYVLLRLPLEVRDLFREWLMANFPDRYRHVFKLVRETRDGKDYDSSWGKRQTGTGPIAWMIGRRFEVACEKLGFNKVRTKLTTEKFTPPRRGPEQLADLSIEAVAHGADGGANRERCAGVLPADCAPARPRPLGRHHHHAAVPHAALGDHVLGEMLDRAGLALEHRHLQATVVIEVNVQGRQRQFVMVVEGFGEAAGKLPRGMIVDVDQRGDAVALGVEALGGLADAGAGKVADGFRSVLIARLAMMRSSSAMRSSSMVMVTRCMEVPAGLGGAAVARPKSSIARADRAVQRCGMFRDKQARPDGVNDLGGPP